MKHYVLDTNIVSLIVKRHALVVSRFRSIVTTDDVLIACPVVWHEAKRGLLAKSAQSQIERFEALSETFIWQDYDMRDWELATQLWIRRRSMGMPIGDADLFIAVYAINRNAILVTDNEKDFSGLSVTIENWAR